MHIIGAGGHAKVIIETLILNNQPIDGVWDDHAKHNLLNIFPIIGTVEEFKRKKVIANTVVAIGNNAIRKAIVEQIDVNFGIVINSKSAISGSAILSEGCVVMANVTVNAEAYIGKHVILNTNSSVDHDCHIADFVHISPQVALAGAVHIGEGTHIGIGACVIQGVSIGKWVTVGAGAVILKNIPDYAVVVGNPGRIIKYNNNENER